MPIIQIRNENGEFVSVPALQGTPGKSPYEAAVEGGYPSTATEESFNQDLANVIYSIQDKTSKGFLYFNGNSVEIQNFEEAENLEI